MVPALAPNAIRSSGSASPTERIASARVVRMWIAYRNCLRRTKKFLGRKGPSPRRASKQALLPHSPKRAQAGLKSLLYLAWLAPDPSVSNPRSVSWRKSHRLPLNGLHPFVGCYLILGRFPRSCSYGPLSLSHKFLPRCFAFGQKNGTTLFVVPGVYAITIDYRAQDWHISANVNKS
jgi:hypothetical protein